jgi:hypothetical protein
MDEWLAICRYAFRKVHGLGAGAPPPLTDALRRELPARARRHRLSGLLHAALPEAGLGLQAAAYGKAQHAARCTLEAERLVALLSADIPGLALLKGPALAAQAWPEPGLRSYDDLDFLCDRRDFPRLLRGLGAAGYTPETAAARRCAHLWHYGWGVTFLDAARTLAVEANHRFFPPHYPGLRTLNVRRADLFRAQRLDGGDVRAPAPGVHLLYSALHAVWHGWARLAWLADIAGLLVRHPGALAQARALAAETPFARRVLAAAGGAAEAVFGPGLFPAAAPDDPRVAGALALFAGAARGLQGRELRALHEQFMTRAEKTAYRLRRIAIPGDGDFQWIPLPPALRGGYWLLRPLRAALT